MFAICLASTAQIRGKKAGAQKFKQKVPSMEWDSKDHIKQTTTIQRFGKSIPTNNTC